jgi:Spy/CpxP family protein refolding chaperone
MRRLITLTIASAAFLIALAAGANAAAADPSFGPGGSDGQGNNAPHETPGTRCHPPGQTVDLPECN